MTYQLGNLADAAERDAIAAILVHTPVMAGLAADGVTDDWVAFKSFMEDASLGDLHVPAGVTVAIAVPESVTIAPARGKRVYGAGKLLCTWGTGASTYREVFSIVNDDFYWDLDVEIGSVDQLNGTLVFVELQGGGGMSLSIPNLEGNVRFIGDAPDETTNRAVIVVDTAGTSVETHGWRVGGHNRWNYWKNITRSWLMTNSSAAICERFVWENIITENVYSENLSLNGINGRLKHYKIRNLHQKNNLSGTRPGSSEHLKLFISVGGTAHGTIENVSMEGTGSFIHVEEDADYLNFNNLNAELTSPHAYGIFFTDNQNGGEVRQARHNTFTNFTLKGPGKGTSTANGIWFANNPTGAPPASHVTFSNGSVTGFFRGLACDDQSDDEGVQVTGVHFDECTEAIYGVHANPLVSDNVVYKDNDILFVVQHPEDDVSWGGNRCHVIEHYKDETSVPDTWHMFYGSDGTQAATVDAGASHLVLTSGGSAFIGFDAKGVQRTFKSGLRPMDFGERGVTFTAEVRGINNNHGIFLGFTDQNSTLEEPAYFASSNTPAANADTCVGWAVSQRNTNTIRWWTLHRSEGGPVVGAEHPAAILQSATYRRLSVTLYPNGDVEYWVDRERQGRIAAGIDPATILYPTITTTSLTSSARTCEVRLHELRA